MTSARVEILEPVASQQDLEELTHSLRAELLLLDVDDATSAVPEDGPPAGARGLDAGQVGALLVTLESSLPLLTAVIKTAQAWMTRSQAPSRIVRVTIGDNSIELSGASGQQQDQLVAAFVQSSVGAEPPI